MLIREYNVTQLRWFPSPIVWLYGPAKKLREGAGLEGNLWDF